MAINDRPVNNSILYDESGKAVLIDSTHGPLIIGDLEYAINSGLIVGAISGTVQGYASTASTGITSLRATTYTEKASATQMEVLSSSASDASAGTGTRTLRITYYDNNMDGPFIEDKTMNGTNPVATSATDIRFIEKVETLTVGSNGTNVGTITIRTVSAGATAGTIAIGDGITNWSHHYVPSGRTCFIKRLISGALGNSGVVFLRVALPLTANSFEKQFTPNLRTVTAQPSQIYDTENYTITGPARITTYVRADSNTACTWTGGFSYYEL